MKKITSLLMCILIFMCSVFPVHGEKMNPYKGRTAAFYGDSVTEVNWHYKKGYYTWMQEILGFSQVFNYGKSAYTISTVLHQLADKTETADLIFILIGINDQTFSTPVGRPEDMTDKTVYGAMNLFAELIKNKYADRNIIFITPHYQNCFMGDYTTMTKDVADVMLEVCIKNGLTVYNNYDLSGINKNTVKAMTTDGCHWTDSTHEKIGRELSLYMMNEYQYKCGANAHDFSEMICDDAHMKEPGNGCFPPLYAYTCSICGEISNEHFFYGEILKSPGDTDADGFVTSADARLTLRYSVNLEAFTEKQKILADIDRSLTVEASDARIILRQSVGLK